MWNIGMMRCLECGKIKTNDSHRCPCTECGKPRGDDHVCQMTELEKFAMKRARLTLIKTKVEDK